MSAPASDHHSDPYRRTRADWAIIALTIAIGLGIIWAFRLRGWYAHDEGALGQSAERILSGQIPHRDFDDPYSGGLALLHALVFRLGGISINAIRNHFALVSSVWFLGVLTLLTRWLRPVGAALVALLIVVFSVPLYPAAMPSWYVLFLTTAAGGALVVMKERPRAAAFIAGGLIGVAALAKVTALFAFAGALWAIVAIHQLDTPRRRGSIEVLLGAPAFATLVIYLLQALPTMRVWTHLALPAIVVAFGIAWREWREGRSSGFGADLELWRRAATLTAGAALPVAIFAAWLWRHDALIPFLESLHGLAARRAAAASYPPPSVRSLLYAVPLLAILIVGGSRLGIRPFILVVGGLTLGILAWFYPYVHADLWRGLRGLIPLSAAAFAFYWPWAGRDLPATTAARGLVVFAPLTAVTALGQFPFAAPIYFLYVLPLLLISLAAAVSLRTIATRRVAGILAALWLLFGIVEVMPGAPDSLAEFADHAPDLAWLVTPRGRLLVRSDDAALYHTLVATIDSLPPGPIWAGPDAPEVAFLTGRVDLNRTLFSFLSESDPAATEFASHMMAEGARAVVINTAPSFSIQVSDQARDSITRYFPYVATVDRFEIHWRESGQ